MGHAANTICYVAVCMHVCLIRCCLHVEQHKEHHLLICHGCGIEGIPYLCEV